MGQALKQNTDGSMGVQGIGYGDGEFVLDGRSWNASSVSSANFVASRPYILKAVSARIETAGTDAGAVTATVYMAPAGTALAAGTALSAAINLKGTALSHPAVALTAAAAQPIPAGFAVGLVFSGVMTAASGGLSLALCPA